MYVELLQDFGAWKKGDIPMESIPEGVARSMVAEGQAREVDITTFLERSVQSEMKKAKDELTELARSGSRPSSGNDRGRKGPPGTGVDFDRISAGDSSEEKDPQRGSMKIKPCFGDFCRCTFYAQALDTPEVLRSWGMRRLANVYGAERCEYVVDEQTGEITQTISRSLDYAHTVMRTGTDSVSGGPTYGFAVKPEYMGNLFEIAMEQSVFAGAAFQVPMGQSNELRWPAFDQYRTPQTVNGIRQAASFGGFSLSYAGEVTQRTASDAALSDITFKIVDLTGFTSLSRDLLADNYIAMDALAQRQFARAFVFMEDYMSIYGDGVGKPQGFFNARALQTVNRNSPSKILYEDLVAMQKKLHPQCWPGARWLVHISTLDQLVAIKNAAGNLVYQPNTQISQAMYPSVIGQSTYDRGERVARPQGVLLGMPLYVTEKVQGLGIQGDLNLVCPSEYGIARRSGLEVGLSEHFYFDTDRVAMRFKMRHDGKSLWRNVYTQLDGVTTTSPFVQLV